MRWIVAWFVDPVVREAVDRAVRAEQDAAGWQEEAVEWRRVAAVYERQAKRWRAQVLCSHPSAANWSEWEKELDR